MHITISNIKLIVPIYQVWRVILWVVNVNIKQVVTKLWILFVCKNVKMRIITNDVLNTWDMFSVIKINFFSCIDVYVKNILRRGYNELCLIFVEFSEFRWILKSVLKTVYCSFFFTFIHIIPEENLIFCEEKHFIWIFVWENEVSTSIFKFKLSDFFDFISWTISWLSEYNYLSHNLSVFD